MFDIEMKSENGQWRFVMHQKKTSSEEFFDCVARLMAVIESFKETEVSEGTRTLGNLAEKLEADWSSKPTTGGFVNPGRPLVRAGKTIVKMTGLNRPDFGSAKDAALYYGVHVTTIYGWAREGKLDTVIIPSKNNAWREKLLFKLSREFPRPKGRRVRRAK